jgi:hypothetical protein
MENDDKFRSKLGNIFMLVSGILEEDLLDYNLKD